MKQRILIWFRRFRPNYGQKFRFHTALAEACSGLAYPITIQDRSYSSTLLGSFFGRAWWVLPVAFLGFIIGLFLIMALSLTIFPKGISKLALVLSMVLMGIMLVYPVYKVFWRLGYKTYRGQNARIDVGDDLESIKSGKQGNVMGVDVFKCDDQVWQDVVTEALENADIAVFDLSEPTENIGWEVSQALKLLPGDRIVFVCEVGAENPTSPIAKLLKALPGIETDLDVNTVKDRIVTYPSTRAGVGPGRRRQVVELAKRLRIEIANRMLQD